MFLKRAPILRAPASSPPFQADVPDLSESMGIHRSVLTYGTGPRSRHHGNRLSGARKPSSRAVRTPAMPASAGAAQLPVRLRPPAPWAGAAGPARLSQIPAVCLLSSICRWPRSPEPARLSIANRPPWPVWRCVSRLLPPRTRKAVLLSLSPADSLLREVHVDFQPHLPGHASPPWARPTRLTG